MAWKACCRTGNSFPATSESAQFLVTNPENIICEIALRDAAVVDYDLGWLAASHGDAGRGRRFRPYFQPLPYLALVALNGKGNFGTCGAEVFQGHGYNLYSVFAFPWMDGLHAKVGEAAVVVDPVVEEPAEVAPGGRLD